MTENNRLATAAAAIVARMMTRSNVLVLRPLSPRRKSSAPCVAIAEQMPVDEFSMLPRKGQMDFGSCSCRAEQKGEGGETREEASSALILGCISLVESEVFE